jgi:hypothetical protein
MPNGRRQPSCDGTSRMTRECQVRICERLGVKFPGPTRHSRPIALDSMSAHASIAVHFSSSRQRSCDRPPIAFTVSSPRG